MRTGCRRLGVHRCLHVAAPARVCRARRHRSLGVPPGAAVLEELRAYGGDQDVVHVAGMLGRCHGVLDGLRQGSRRRGGGTTAELRSAARDVLQAVSAAELVSQCDQASTTTAALFGLLGRLGKLSTRHGVHAPPQLRAQLLHAIIAREDTLACRDLAGAARAAVGAFSGQQKLAPVGAPSPLLAMIARRAEQLIADGHADAVSKCPSDAATWFEQLATVAWCFGRLQTFNSRLIEEVLVPAVAAAASHDGDGDRRLQVPEQSVAKLCWAVGQLGPPIPALHESIGVIADAIIPRANDISTLANITWWSAVMSGLGPAAAAVGDVQAVGCGSKRRCSLVVERLEVLLQRRRDVTRKGKRSTTAERLGWCHATGNIAWALACHQFSPRGLPLTPRGCIVRQLLTSTSGACLLGGVDLATRCRLHQYFVEQGGGLDQDQRGGGQADSLRDDCRNAFVQVAQKVCGRSLPMILA
jgi:hypothetical protein